MRNFKAPPLTEGARIEIERTQTWLLKSDLPLYVEVGCGAGYHPLAFVRENPKSRILAFERTALKFAKADQRLRMHLKKSEEYERCLIVHGDAAHLWDALIPPHSIAGLYFLYPNPYPKKQHANRRLAHMPFFKTAIQSLKVNSHLIFATNELFYYEELSAALDQKDLRIELKGIIPALQKPRSHFEKKYLERGETCYQIVGRKI